jgi:branched-chain amino acid transport system substrate-binding protein
MSHAVTERTLSVGAILSLSGRFAVQGEQAQRGLTLWADDLNAAGGLFVRARGKSVPVQLTVHDDASRIEPATRLVERLANPTSPNRVDLLIGPYSSVLTLAVAPVTERHRRVLWNHGGSSDAINEAGLRYVVTVLSPAGRYFAGLLDMVRATAPAARRLAILHGARGTFPRAVAAGAEAYARTLGFEVVLMASYPALIEQVRAQQPDLILGVGTTEADLAFAQALGADRAGAQAIGLVAASIEHFGTTLGPAVHGIFGPSQWEPGVRYQPDLGPTSAQLVARFRTRFHAEPDYPAAQGYAAGLIAQRCVEIAGTLDDDALLQVAHDLALTTFYGDFRLDPATHRQVGHDLVVVQWQRGQRRIVWPPAVAEAAPEIPSP